jgi:hypothetical protein
MRAPFSIALFAAFEAVVSTSLNGHGDDPYTAFPLPPSNDTVSVRMLDSFHSNFPDELFFAPNTALPTASLVPLAGWAFLLEHARTGRRVLFDLGIRHDFSNLAPAAVAQFGGFPWNIGKDVPTQLVDANVSLQSIDSVIWRFVFPGYCPTQC